MPKLRLLVLALMGGLLLAGITTFTDAQNDGGEICPAFVEQALDALENNCDALDRNNACYGFNQVDSTFIEEVAADFFALPSDRTRVALLETLRTAALDLDTNLWGIAVMSIQADLPNTLPGQAVNFILLGDAEVENRVAPEDAFISELVVPVTVIESTIARSGPGLNTNAVGPVEPGDELEADAVSGDWLRVVVEERPAWVLREAVDGPADALDELPEITEQTRAPMQAFYFRTGFGLPTCNESPDLIAVRSPENIRVNLDVNGATIGIGSTILFKSIDENTSIFFVYEGTLELPDGRLVEAGQTVEVVQDEDGNIIEIGEIREATGEETEWGEISDNVFRRLGMFSSDDEAADDDETTGDDEEVILPTATPTAAPPPAVPPAPPAPPQIVVDCSAFRPTSPRDGLAYGETTFYWDAAPGATSYRVTVFNDGEGRTLTFEVDAPTTTLTGVLDQNTIGGGFQFSWRVDALRNGQVACEGQRLFIPRAAPQPPAPAAPTGPFSTTLDCSGDDNVIFIWSGLPAGSTITFFYEDLGFDSFDSGPLSAESGVYDSGIQDVVLPVAVIQPSGDAETYGVSLFGCS